MATDEPTPGVTHLEPPACWALLRSHEVGRLAVSIGDRPDIFPINYVVDHGAVVFRTAEGTKLAGAIKGEAVAFEADGYEPDSGEAWSVVVKGHACVTSPTLLGGDVPPKPAGPSTRPAGHAGFANRRDQPTPVGWAANGTSQRSPYVRMPWMRPSSSNSM